MVKELMHDPIFLAQRSENAGIMDLQTAKDLLDTLTAHRAGCVGMAANMIGVKKRIICFDNNGTYMTMLNPEIIKMQGEFEAEEGCLSLLGEPRKTKRFRKITVRFQDLSLKQKTMSFNGFTAQIIQHEVDHCNGILI